jgi:hypothetical protein
VTGELERMWNEVVVAKFTVLYLHFPGWTEENHKKPQSRYWSLDQNLNPGPPEYKTGVLTTQP